MGSFIDTFEAHDAAILAAVGDDVKIEGRAVRGEFAAAFIGPNLGGQRTGLNEPNFSARTVDVADVIVGHVLTYKEIDYKVVRVEPGEGITTLVLRRA